MKIDITITVDVDSVYQADEIAKVFKLLVDKGAMSGVKGGQSIIHWDGDGKFKGISFDYWVYRERA